MTLDGNYDNEENVHVLTRIPGRSENSAAHGSDDPQHKFSAVPGPFDQWFHGDFTKDWETTYDPGTLKKFLAEYDDTENPFPNYRMDTAIEIGFDTSGNSISGTPEVKMTDPDDSTTPGDLAPVTLEGEPDEPENDFRTTFDHYDDDQGGQYHAAGVEGRYTDVNESFTVSTSDGDVEGVRASIILGTNDPYLVQLKKDVVTLSEVVTGPLISLAALRFFNVVATFYSFIDFAYMADGTKVVTVWDASRYPAHALYVGGEYRDENIFREGIEWVEIGPMEAHTAFDQFGRDAVLNPAATPFDQGGNFLYDGAFGLGDGFRTGFGDHPVMDHMEPGSVLLGTESEFQNPMYPNFPVI